MTEARKFRAIKGTRDLLPPETALWNRVERIAQEVFTSYGFAEIRLPIFETSELFARSIGAETDVVAKEMYSFEDWPENLDDPRKRIFNVDEISQLEEAMSKGQLPNTESNREAIAELRKIVGEMDAAQAKGKAPGETDMSWLAGFRRIVSEYVWQAQSISGHNLALRPEVTASVVRAYIEHGMHTLPGDVKLYCIGPMFRRERPQKGRFRQFYQIDAEVLGQSDAPTIDAEVIEMLLVFFSRVGLPQTALSINSIGCRNCRPKYVECLRSELQKVKDKLGPDSQRRIETNPLRVLDSKLPEEQAIIEKLPKISDHLCPDCRAHFAKLKEELKLRGIAYKENWRLVRGLDYYTRTTFEVTAAGLGAQDAVCGGGRYDGLVELLGGPAAVKGIGFAIGSDRAILSIQEAGKPPAPRGLDVFIAWMSGEAYPTAVKVSRRLRGEGFSVELPPEEMKLKKSLGLADKLGARYAVILGEDEVKAGNFTVKRLADSEQKKVSEAELVEYLKAGGAGRKPAAS